MAEGGGGIPEPPASPEIEEEGGQEVPEIPGPRSFVILQEDDTFDFAYTIGTLDLDFTEGDKSCEIAAIAVIDNKLLVAVPEAVWSRSVQKRRLGSRALTKPNLVAVASCLEDAREAEDDIVVQLRVWVGFLHPELEKNLEFLGPAEARLHLWRTRRSTSCAFWPCPGGSRKRAFQLHDSRVCSSGSFSTRRLWGKVGPPRSYDEGHEVWFGCFAESSYRWRCSASPLSKEAGGRWHRGGAKELLDKTEPLCVAWIPPPWKMHFKPAYLQLIFAKLERS